jgi:hypothetical protein
MDPCVPGISLANARAHARIKLGVPSKYANKMSVAGICKAAKQCKTTNIMPPMEYRQFKGKMYLIDPKSPLSIKDFVLLLGKGSTDDIKRISKSIGLVTNSVTKSELKSNIIKILQTLNISEPIEIPVKQVRNKVPLNNMSGNNGTGVTSGNNGTGGTGGTGGNNGTGGTGGTGGNNGTGGTGGNNGTGGTGGNNGTGGTSEETGGSGNNGTNPGSGEHPYNENVAPQVRLAARPSKVRTINNTLNNNNNNNNSNFFKARKPTNLNEPITRERLRQDMELSENIRQELSGNN